MFEGEDQVQVYIDGQLTSWISRNLRMWIKCAPLPGGGGKGPNRLHPGQVRGGGRFMCVDRLRKPGGGDAGLQPDYRSYKAGENIVGALGVIGPKRMPIPT